MDKTMKFNYCSGKRTIQKYTANRLYFSFKPNEYDQTKIEFLNRDYKKNYKNALNSLTDRLSKDYYNKLYPSIFFWNSISSKIFPVYKFLIPTILNTDWVATIDWKKYHRDHLLHQPLTTYIVEKLLSDPKSPVFKNMDRIVDNLASFHSLPFTRLYLSKKGLNENSRWLRGNRTSKHLWKEFFIETVVVASLFHDMGYPWQKHSKDKNIIDCFTDPIILDENNSKLKDILKVYPFFLYSLNGYNLKLKCIEKIPNPFYNLKCWNNCCQFPTKNETNHLQRFCGILNKSYKKTHGLPGAFTFIHLNNGFKKNGIKENPIRSLAVEWAASAIAMHDMKSIYWGSDKISNPDVDFLRIDAKKDPISAVLTLADILQEFERPNAIFHTNEEGISTVDYRSDCSSVGIQFTDKTLRIVYYMKTKGSQLIKKQFLVKEQKELFDPQYGFLDLSYWGVEKVTMKAVYQPNE